MLRMGELTVWRSKRCREPWKCRWWGLCPFERNLTFGPCIAWCWRHLHVIQQCGAKHQNFLGRILERQMESIIKLRLASLHFLNNFWLVYRTICRPLSLIYLSWLPLARASKGFFRPWIDDQCSSWRNSGLSIQLRKSLHATMRWFVPLQLRKS